MKNESELRLLQTISNIIVREKDVQALLNEVLEVLCSQLGMLRGTFTFRNGNMLTIEASVGLDETEKKRGHYLLGEGIIGQVAQSGKAIVVPDISRDSRFLNRTGARDNSKLLAFICVPIIRQDEVIGTLSVDRIVTAGVELDEDAAMVEIIGNITADAVFACRSSLEEKNRLMDENRKLREMLLPAPGELIGNSSRMREVFEAARLVAKSDATVLIYGSAGTGKSVLARAIISMSDRKDKPVHTLNCASLPEILVESELFGHERGAFISAVSQKAGYLETTDGGTLFIGGIDDLSMSTQMKILRYLKEHVYFRVGSDVERHSNVRLIVASSKNLEKQVIERQFIEELYYNLNAFPILMPDLKDRRGDVLILADHFISQMNVKYNKKISKLSPGAINLLMSYPWPGNVRELSNCIERAVLASDDNCIHSENLPASLQSAADDTFNVYGHTRVGKGNTLASLVKNYEREIVMAVLKRNKGNISAMGRELGLSPRMACYKLKTLGIQSE